MEETLEHALIARLKKISCELISDAFDKLNIKNKIIRDIPPVNKKMKACGKAYTVLFCDVDDARPSLFKFNRFFLDDVPKDVVIVIENSGKFENASVWGGLLNHFSQKKSFLGTITNGRIRDIDSIESAPYPVFASGTACSNSTGRYKIVAVQEDIRLNGITISPNDYIVADYSGIVVIPSDKLEDVVTFAEKKKSEEAKIVKLIDAGLSLEDIHKVMSDKNKLPVEDEKPKQSGMSLKRFGLFAVTAIAVGVAYQNSITKTLF